MQIWNILIILFGLSSLVFFIKSLVESNKKKNIYGLTPHLFYLGSFVWGDMIVLGPFWAIVSLLTILLNNLSLFLLIYSLFWVIRSLGEIIYWLNEQFAFAKRNPPHTLRFHKIFNSDAIWFIYQLFWECIFIISILSSLYFGREWLLGI